MWRPAEPEGTAYDLLRGTIGSYRIFCRKEGRRPTPVPTSGSPKSCRRPAGAKQGLQLLQRGHAPLPSPSGQNSAHANLVATDLPCQCSAFAPTAPHSETIGMEGLADLALGMPLGPGARAQAYLITGRPPMPGPRGTPHGEHRLDHFRGAAAPHRPRSRCEASGERDPRPGRGALHRASRAQRCGVTASSAGSLRRGPARPKVWTPAADSGSRGCRGGGDGH